MPMPISVFEWIPALEKKLLVWRFCVKYVDWDLNAFVKIYYRINDLIKKNRVVLLCYTVAHCFCWLVI